VDKQGAGEFIKQMAAAYPALDLYPERVKLWIRFLERVPFDLAMERLDHHIAASRFPPSIADILNASRRTEAVRDYTGSNAPVM